MNKDLGLFFINDCFDLLIDGGDLAGDGGLETAITISLFSDTRVTDEELNEESQPKRGWWGDSISEVDKHKVGSKMWLLDRGKRTATDLFKLQQYAQQSLNWMIEDGIVSNVTVEGAFEEGQTVLNISVTKPEDIETRYEVIWNAQEIRRR